MAPIILMSGFMYANVRRSVSFFERSARTTNSALANWLMTVAIAAPCTPMPKVNMNRGSSPMFSAAPTMTDIIAIRLLPCAVRKVLRPVASCTNSVPVRYTVR